MATEIHVDDYGTLIEVTIEDDAGVVDLTGYVTAEIILKKPDGTLVTKTATVPVPETDGKMQYVTEAGIIDQKGCWQIQARVQLLAGNWKSTTDEFHVYPNL